MRHFRSASPFPVVAVLVGCLSVIPIFDAAFAWPSSKPKTNPQLDENNRSMRQKAEDGMAEAQMVMAKWCIDGSVLPQDHAEATRWYEMAAKQGNAEAMMALARMLNEGEGIQKNVRKSHEWYVAAARKGNAEAYMELGRIFEDGDGVTANKGKAIKLYEEGAKRGSAEAAMRLAWIYGSDSELGDAEKRDHYLEIASDLGGDTDKESIFLLGLYNQMQNQAKDQVTDSQRHSNDETDEWGFYLSDASVQDSSVPVAQAAFYGGHIGSAANAGTSAGLPYVITEADRQYDLELQRKAEMEWNEHARQTGGMMFVGEPGSGQLGSSPQNRFGPTRQPYDEEAAIAYATRIGGLVGGAAGLEYQLNQMIEDAKRYQEIAEYSTDWNEQVNALRKAEALILSIPQIKSDYYDAENTLISLRVRDGQLFDDAMRATISTPEVDPIIRAYCRGLIGE